MMTRSFKIESVTAALIVGALAVLGACSGSSEATPECSTDADCAGEGLQDTKCHAGRCRVPAPDPDPDASTGALVDPIWGCVGNVPPVPKDTSVPATLQFTLLDSKGSGRLAGAAAVACEASDLDCAQPLVGSAVTSGGDGNVDVPVYTGFDGYIKVTTPDEAHIPTYVVAPPDNAGDGKRTHLTVFAKDTLALVTSVLMTPVKPDQGHVIFTAKDCQQNFAAGVSANADPVGADTSSFYLDSNVTPSKELKETSVPGVGGMFNLPPGVATLTISKAGARVGSRAVPVRAGHITMVMVPPN